MRILFLTSKLNYKTAGGSVPDLDLKVRDLMALGHDVAVITAFSKGNILDPKPPYRVYEERVSTKSLFTTQPEIYRLLKRYEDKADVFHVEGQFMYGAGAYRMFGGRVPVVAFFNRELISWPNEPYVKQTFKRQCRFLLEKFIGTPIASRMDGFIITSPQLRDAFRAFGLAERPTRILPDFVDSEGVRKIAGMEHEPNSEDPCVIFCTGRMIPEKGFNIVLRAFARLEHRDRYQLVIGGDGPEETKLRELANQLGISTFVTFTGWIEKNEMLRRLAAANMFVLPKWRIELTSVILFEAMSLGIPPIVMAGGGLEWLIGDAGLTFPAGNDAELAERIMKVASYPPLRSSLSEKSLARMREFDHEKMANEMEALMVDVVKRP